jgi:hypothetical protein
MHADEEVLQDAEAIQKDLGKCGWLNVRGFALRQTQCRFRGAGRQVDRPKRNCNWHLSGKGEKQKKNVLQRMNRNTVLK